MTLGFLVFEKHLKLLKSVRNKSVVSDENVYEVEFVSNKNHLLISKESFEQLQYDISNKKEFTILDDAIINHSDISNVYKLNN